MDHCHSYNLTIAMTMSIIMLIITMMIFSPAAILYREALVVISEAKLTSVRKVVSSSCTTIRGPVVMRILSDFRSRINVPRKKKKSPKRTWMIFFTCDSHEGDPGEHYTALGHRVDGDVLGAE